MITEIQLSALLLFAAIIWGILLILNGTSVSFDLLKPLSDVVGVVVIGLSIFDKWAWRWRIFYPWLVSIPNVQGTWKGTIQSLWINPETRTTPPAIEAYLVIRQTFSSIHVRLITKEANSETLAGNIVKDNDGSLTIATTYRSTTNMLVREKSPIHHGGMLLCTRGKPPTRLDGEYWTDRNTKGQLLFTAKNQNTFDDFETAMKALYL